MRRLIGGFLLVLLACAHTVSAQTPPATPANKLQWDEVGQAATYASTATYHVFLDGTTTSVPLANVVCVAGTPAANATCTADFPAMTPGTHTLVGIQSISGVDSPKSSPPFAFTFVVVVTPTGFRVV